MALNPVQFQRGYSMRCVDLPEADPDVFERMHPRGKDAKTPPSMSVGLFAMAGSRWRRFGSNGAGTMRSLPGFQAGTLGVDGSTFT